MLTTRVLLTTTLLTTRGPPQPPQYGRPTNPVPPHHGVTGSPQPTATQLTKGVPTPRGTHSGPRHGAARQSPSASRSSTPATSGGTYCALRRASPNCAARSLFQ